MSAGPDSTSVVAERLAALGVPGVVDVTVDGNRVDVRRRYESRSELVGVRGTQDTFFIVQVELLPDASTFRLTTRHDLSARGSSSEGIFASREFSSFSGTRRVREVTIGVERGGVVNEHFDSAEVEQAVRGVLADSGWTPEPRRGLWASLFRTQ